MLAIIADGRKHLVFRGRVGRKFVMAFVDSDAEISMIGKSLLSASSKLARTTITVFGIGNGTAPLLGMIDLEIRFGTTSCRVRIFVCEDRHVPISGSVFLGLDFLTNHDLMISFKKRSIHFGNPSAKIMSMSVDKIVDLKSTTTGTVSEYYRTKFTKLFFEREDLPPVRPGHDVVLEVDEFPAPSREIRVKNKDGQDTIAKEAAKLEKLRRIVNAFVNPCSAFLV